MNEPYVIIADSYYAAFTVTYYVASAFYLLGFVFSYVLLLNLKPGLISTSDGTLLLIAIAWPMASLILACILVYQALRRQLKLAYKRLFSSHK